MVVLSWAFPLGKITAVLRPALSLVAASAALLMPTLGGGSDVSRVAAGRAISAAASAAAEAEPPTSSDAVVAAHPAPSPPSMGHGAKTAFLPASGPRELVLSFDDGPDLKGTPLILEELDRRGLKAIFFVSGWRLVGDSPEGLARRDLVRKIASHGHLVANHTMNHKDLCENPELQAEEIDGNSEIVTQATGVRPLLFRAPYGAYCRSLEDSLAARDLVDIGWNIDPQDWNGTTPEEILAYLIRKLTKLEGRGILLLHDTHTASVRSFPVLLDWIARENHRAVKERRPPIALLDYSVLLPKHSLPRTGLETIFARLAGDIGSAFRLLPARSILMGTLGGSPNPPAMGSERQSRSSPARYSP